MTNVAISANPPLPTARLWLFGTCLAIVCSLSSVARPAEITLLDGSTVQGDVQAWQDGTLELRTGAGPTSLAARQILRIRFREAGGDDAVASVELTDGSLLPIDQFTVVDGEGTIQVASVEQPLTVATEKLAAVHLLPPTPAIAAQWKDLRQAEEVGDLIVIRKDGGVDYLAGRLGGVTEEHVTFYLDEDEYPVERSKVDGLVYFHAQPHSFPDPLCVVYGDGGLKLVASHVTLEGDVLRVRTRGGVELALPLANVESADFSGGKVMYLSELTPRSASTTPLVALPVSAELVAGFVGPLTNRGFFSPQALLRHPRYEDEKIVGWELRPHRQSLGMRSRSEIVYQLPEGFSGFRALAGIDGTLGGRGHVHLAIFGDDRLLWEHAIDGKDPPATIELELAGARRLRIVADYGQRGDTADRLYLCEARITK